MACTTMVNVHYMESMDLCTIHNQALWARRNSPDLWPKVSIQHENVGANVHSQYMDECTGNGKYLESFLRSSSVPATLGDALLFDAPYFFNLLLH